MSDYHDYVIKDGKFIGKFEEMYSDCENPWFQKEDAEVSYSRHDTIHTINRFGLKNVIEVGCGLGYFTNLLQKGCGDSKIVGVDISETAVKKAKEKFPEIDFYQGEVKDLDTIFDLEQYDGIVFAEILWYILDDLDDVLEKLKKKFNGILIINQVFYHGEQKYGRDYFTNQQELIEYIKSPVLVKNFSDDTDHVVSYETHTVFDFR